MSTTPPTHKPAKSTTKRKRTSKQSTLHGSTVPANTPEQQADVYVQLHQHHLHNNATPFISTLLSNKRRTAAAAASDAIVNKGERYRASLYDIDSQIQSLIEQREAVHRQFAAHVDALTIDIGSTDAVTAHNNQQQYALRVLQFKACVNNLIEYWSASTAREWLIQCGILNKCANQEPTPSNDRAIAVIDTVADDVDMGEDKRLDSLLQLMSSQNAPAEQTTFAASNAADVERDDSMLTVDSRPSDRPVFDYEAHETGLLEFFTQMPAVNHATDNAVSDVKSDVKADEHYVADADSGADEALAAEEDRIASESQSYLPSDLDEDINVIDLSEVNDLAFENEVTPPRSPVRSTAVTPPQHPVSPTYSANDSVSVPVDRGDSDVVAVNTPLKASRPSMPALEPSSQNSDVRVMDDETNVMTQRDIQMQSDELLAHALAVEYEDSMDSTATRLHDSEPQILAELNAVRERNGSTPVMNDSSSAAVLMPGVCKCKCHRVSPHKHNDIKQWPDDKLKKQASTFGLRTLSKPQMIKRLGSIFDKLQVQKARALCTCACNNQLPGSAFKQHAASGGYHSDTAVTTASQQKRGFKSKQLSDLSALLADALPSKSVSRPTVEPAIAPAVSAGKVTDVTDEQRRQLKQLIRSNEDLHVHLLLLQPMDIRVIQARMEEQMGIQMNWQTLQKLLDGEGVVSIYNNSHVNGTAHGSRLPTNMQRRRRR